MSDDHDTSTPGSTGSRRTGEAMPWSDDPLTCDRGRTSRPAWQHDLDLRIRAIEKRMLALQVIDRIEDLENEQLGIKGRLRELENWMRALRT
jgi:hypothetical protein